MAKKTVKFLLNIGTNDVAILNLEKAYKEGDLVSLEEQVADKLIEKRFAVLYDEAAQKADDELRERERENAVKAAIPAAKREAAQEAAKAEAQRQVSRDAKGGKSAQVETPAGPTKISEHPHVPKPDKS